MWTRGGGLTFELVHARGEADDHTYVWIPELKTLCTGDLFIWNSPNAGNPQKAQRYPVEWARALRDMQDLGAEVLLPGHGVPITGAGRIRQALGDTAELLESLCAQTRELMNAGARLDEVLHGVKVPPGLLEKPYLHPAYDEPEFVVRNLWRLWGGWYDQNPANLKPAPKPRRPPNSPRPPAARGRWRTGPGGCSPAASCVWRRTWPRPPRWPHPPTPTWPGSGPRSSPVGQRQRPRRWRAASSTGPPRRPPPWRRARTSPPN